MLQYCQTLYEQCQVTRIWGSTCSFHCHPSHPACRGWSRGSPAPHTEALSPPNHPPRIPCWGTQCQDAVHGSCQCPLVWKPENNRIWKVEKLAILLLSPWCTSHPHLYLRPGKASSPHLPQSQTGWTWCGVTITYDEAQQQTLLTAPYNCTYTGWLCLKKMSIPLKHKNNPNMNPVN